VSRDIAVVSEGNVNARDRSDGAYALSVSRACSDLRARAVHSRFPAVGGGAEGEATTGPSYAVAVLSIGGTAAFLHTWTNGFAWDTATVASTAWR
jgi:hypothetical protein